MSTVKRTDAPIYAQLVRERGDVPSEARRAAEEALRRSANAVDFRLPWRASPYR
ncbi:hypothetical protein [Streptacidiphilus sp. EB103A]|uniref:hypothetical protein n=1 Tax=Streptacidiphilus sp. EB103A TaxID=3156275 RepID=UPI003512896A